MRYRLAAVSIARFKPPLSGLGTALFGGKPPNQQISHHRQVPVVSPETIIPTSLSPPPSLQCGLSSPSLFALDYRAFPSDSQRLPPLPCPCPPCVCYRAVRYLQCLLPPEVTSPPVPVPVRLQSPGKSTFLIFPSRPSFPCDKPSIPVEPVFACFNPQSADDTKLHTHRNPSVNHAARGFCLLLILRLCYYCCCC